MLKLSDLKSPRGARKKKKVVGRGSGSGHGKTSCRGHKGQSSRAGKGRRFGFEGGQMPLIRRIPKRGFNPIFKQEYQLVNLQALNKFKDGTEVNPTELCKLRLIKKGDLPVKILGKGKLTKQLTIKAHKFSKTALKAIEEIGATAEMIKIKNKK